MLIKGYSDFSLDTPGCAPGAPVFRAHCKLDTDMTELFPYINAVALDAEYYDKPHYIQFTLDGVRCALYPDHVAARMFDNREQALKFFGQLIDFLNDLYSRKDSIEPNHKEYRHVPVLSVFKLLPQTNCRECGFSTCMAFSASLSKGETALNQCPELDNPANQNVVKLQSMLS